MEMLVYFHIKYKRRNNQRGPFVVAVTVGHVSVCTSRSVYSGVTLTAATRIHPSVSSILGLVSRLPGCSQNDVKFTSATVGTVGEDEEDKEDDPLVRRKSFVCRQAMNAG